MMLQDNIQPSLDSKPIPSLSFGWEQDVPPHHIPVPRQRKRRLCRGLSNPINSGAAPPRPRARPGSLLIPPPPELSLQFLPQSPECLGLHTREFTPREQSLISALCAGQGCFTPPSITLLDLIPSLMPLGRGL